MYINTKHKVYLLKSETTRRTYIGYTIDVKKRLRKHNGEIKGGAKYTRYGRPWKLICYVTGFPYEKTALQYEWRNHHPPRWLRRKGAGIPRRIKIMKGILQLEKFTNNCIPTSDLKLMIVFEDSSYKKYWI